MPSVAPSGVGSNEYYRTEEEFFHAVGTALRTEYKAIVDAGFLVTASLAHCPGQSDATHHQLLRIIHRHRSSGLAALRPVTTLTRIPLLSP